MTQGLARLFKEGGYIFYANGYSRNRLPTRELRIERRIYTWVNGTQSCLFSHNQVIGSKAEQSSGAVALRGDNDFKSIAKGAKQIGKAPCRKSLTTARVQY